jgi:hypothetical protein
VHLRVSLRIFAFHHASSRSTAHLHISPRIFTFHCTSSCSRTSSCSIAHLRISPRIFAFSRIFTFHRDLVRIIAGASIHCPASSLVCRIPFITISDYVWHRTIIISLWTLTLHHLHTVDPSAHLRVSLHIFAFHRDLVRIITGASIHCPASSLVHRIPFITISVYVWHHMIIISLWTLTLHHLHT